MIEFNKPDNVLNNEKKENEKKENEKENEKEIIKKMDKDDLVVISQLVNLFDALNGEKIDLSKVQNSVEALQQFNSVQEYSYLNNLLHPEKCKSVKIPTPIPVPSCAFQLHNSITLKTNSSGNLALVFNPFFLATDNGKRVNYVDSTAQKLAWGINYYSTLWVNNDDSLDGASSNSRFIPVNIGQVLPDVYDQYRLVSASLVVKYIGRLDIVSGVIGGAIVFDENQSLGAYYSIYNAEDPTEMFESRTTKHPELAKYGNFDLAMDSFYHQENLTLEGIRELYFPIDNSFEEYVKMANIDCLHFNLTERDELHLTADQDYVKSGFNWMLYVLGAPQSSACFKVDMYCNFECLPNAKYLNYLPLSMNPKGVSSQEKRDASLVIQKKPIMKSNENTPTPKGYMPGIWEKLKNKFSGKLPSIAKMIGNGLMDMIPGLKPGLNLAGSLISSMIYD